MPHHSAKAHKTQAARPFPSPPPLAQEEPEHGHDYPNGTCGGRVVMPMFSLISLPSGAGTGRNTMRRRALSRAPYRPPQRQRLCPGRSSARGAAGLASRASDAPSLVQRPVARPLELCLGDLAVNGEPLGPGDEILGDEGQLGPHPVRPNSRKGIVLEARSRWRKRIRCSKRRWPRWVRSGRSTPLLVGGNFPLDAPGVAAAVRSVAADPALGTRVDRSR